jgi:hypothetical protein
MGMEALIGGDTNSISYFHDSSLLQRSAREIGLGLSYKKMVPRLINHGINKRFLMLGKLRDYSGQRTPQISI